MTGEYLREWLCAQGLLVPAEVARQCHFKRPTLELDEAGHRWAKYHMQRPRVDVYRQDEALEAALAQRYSNGDA